MISKKSQFFMFDLIFSFVILVVAIGIALYYSTSSFQEEGLFDLSQNIIDQYTTTSINSLNNQEIRDFFLNNQITNIDNSIAQQSAEFYLDSQISEVQTLNRVFIETYERRNLYISLALINETNSFQTYITPGAPSFENSKTSYVNSREILLIYGDDVKTFTAEVKIWQ